MVQVHPSANYLSMYEVTCVYVLVSSVTAEVPVQRSIHCDVHNDVIVSVICRQHCS